MFVPKRFLLAFLAVRSYGHLVLFGLVVNEHFVLVLPQPSGVAILLLLALVQIEVVVLCCQLLLHLLDPFHVLHRLVLPFLAQLLAIRADLLRVHEFDDFADGPALVCSHLFF